MKHDSRMYNFETCLNSWCKALHEKHSKSSVRAKCDDRTDKIERCIYEAANLKENIANFVIVINIIIVIDTVINSLRTFISL